MSLGHFPRLDWLMIVAALIGVGVMAAEIARVALIASKCSGCA